MKTAIANPDRIDSTCDALPLGTDGPSDFRCGTDASTWVRRPAGHRVYICSDHADQVDRFDDVDVGDHPTVFECQRCFKLTPAAVGSGDRVCPSCRV